MIHGKPSRGAGGIRLLLVAVALLVGGTIGAEEATIVYVDGPVRYLPTAASRESDGRLLEIGDPVADGGVLVLETPAYAEIAGGGSVVRIVGPGRFLLADYFDGSSETPRESGIERISARWRSLLFAEGSRSDTVAGVRGDYAGEEAWGLGDPTGDLIAAAHDARQNGDDETAIALYREALIFDESDAVRLSLAELLFEVGRTTEAVSAVEGIIPSPEESWYTRYAMLSVAVYAGTADTDALTAAVAALDRSAFSTDELQMVEYTLAETLRLDGNREAADDALRRLMAVDPESPLARAAHRILSDS